MSKNTKNNASVNAQQASAEKVEASTAYGITADMFTDDKLLSDVTAIAHKADGGAEVVEYQLLLKGKGDVADYMLTDVSAIKAIKGIQESDKLEKYAAYRKGSFLVQLVDSPFMRDNDVKSISELAKNYELGVETSTANALESVSRKLGVTFDENNNLHFADADLPQLSFWHYSQIISLVTENESGGYKYDSLKDFLRVAHVSPIMSQKKLKEMFNDYRNGRLEGSAVALPDSVTEKARKDAERAQKAEDEKRKAEDAKRVVSASVALEKAESFENKQAVALSAVDALKECLAAIGIDYDMSEMREVICNAEPPKATAKTTENN